MNKENPQSTDNIEVKPWTYGQLVKLSPILEEIVSGIEKESLTLKEIRNGPLDEKKLTALAFKFLPFLGPIVSETIGVSQEEVNKWAFDKIVHMALKIILVNVTLLKEFVFSESKILKEMNNKWRN